MMSRLKPFLPLLVLLGGIAITALFILNPNEAKKRPKPEEQGMLVTTTTTETGDYTIELEAMGQIVPAMEVALKPQVSGTVEFIADSFVPGGFFRMGDPILHIDPEDYAKNKKKQEALLKQAEADYALEMGRQSVARRELDILAKTTGKKLERPNLALREPQLAQARAELEKAQAELDAAKLMLARTTIHAPFNALVTERFVTLGDTVSNQTTLATLVNTDEYWVKISVPTQHLQWLKLATAKTHDPSPAHILFGEGNASREGYLLRMVGTLDPQSRLADLLVAVPDPLLLVGPKQMQDKQPLILGDYVTVKLEGKTLTHVTRLPIQLLRDGNVLWIEKAGTLEIRPVTPLYEDRHYVYFDQGIAPEDQIISSNIPVPVEGMRVRLQSTDEAPAAPAGGQ